MSDPICPECGERHPFYGTCQACYREHCNCYDYLVVASHPGELQEKQR